MKRCPECHRDYYDDSLLYCLEDGVELIQGSVPSTDEPTIAILKKAASSTEPETRRLGPHESLSKSSTNVRTNRNSMIAGVIIVVLITLLGLCSYWFYVREPSKQIESIAVMPFVNESGDADMEYLSDGMTETLISSLSQLPKLNVKARSSVFRYKGKETDARTIGNELNVQAVLNGRVGQRGDQLTLSLELIDARTENVIWSDKYVRKSTDLVTLQNEIARDVSTKLKSKLSGADEEKLEKNYTTNAGAYQFYLLGHFYGNKATVSDFRKSIEFFQQAIAADRNYALAYSGLADAYVSLSEYNGAPPRESIPKAREAALKSLSLDDQLAEAHAILGNILCDDFDFAGAEREYKRALELDPNDARTHARYSYLLTFFARHEEGLAEMRRAWEIEPLSLSTNRAYGDQLFYARRYDESIALLKRTLDLDPNFESAHNSLGYAYWMKANYAESVEEFAKRREVGGDRQLAALYRDSFAKLGWEGFLRMRRDEFQTSNATSYGEAIYAAALDEKSDAFAELNQALENHEFGILLLKVDPRLDPLRADPRFQELVKRVGFPD